MKFVSVVRSSNWEFDSENGTFAREFGFALGCSLKIVDVSPKTDLSSFDFLIRGIFRFGLYSSPVSSVSFDRTLSLHRNDDMFDGVVLGIVESDPIHFNIHIIHVQ